jgi:serine/threonine-protein kinase
LFKIVLSDPTPPRQLAPNLDPGFEPIILKAMAREVEHRFQTCDEFAQALRNYQAGRGMQMADVTGPMPAFNVASAGQVAANAAAAKGGLSTGANWSKTDGQIPTQIPKTNAALVVAILAGGLLVLGGGALAAVKVMHSGAAPAPSASIAEKSTAEPLPTTTAPATASATSTATATAPATAEPPPIASNSGEAKLSATPPKQGVLHPPPKSHALPPPKKGGGGSAKGASGPDFGY